MKYNYCEEMQIQALIFFIHSNYFSFYKRHKLVL